MVNKKRKDIIIKFSNRWIYTLIVIGILAILGVGVFALGSVSNPGHAISELQTCEEGETLQVVDGEWDCVSGGGENLEGWSFSNDYLYDDGEQVIRANDEWLRLNPAGHFTNGVYTPGKLRADGGICLDDVCVNNLRSTGIYYIDNVYCEDYKTFTTSPTCKTRPCQVTNTYKRYYNCYGVCNLNSPYSCPNNLLGYLVE
jgi:hypothetical protein